ncbi:integral membrane sensor signal transduction histidine kinase [Paenibacillus curdlanolyticus YK9]|uniref:Integral membrane sensor signal transduction histidine kinase n=1 Tax=Paenibacillus curdlanolyticus YK9 TaxID=717606 RepID=E0ICS3_9BACL|nr:sensor histidine kinase [Paenibacillus curdlanolyticus]EFM09959.1 integral membrane sensor signal transduction histidine kinase [Paenibacillus curdlanolyticus YK9]
MAPLLIATIGLTGYFSYYVASQLALSKAGQNQTNLTRQTIDHFNNIAQDAIDFSNYLLLSETVQELLSKPDDPEVHRRAFTTLSALMVTRNSIQSLIIYPLEPNSMKSIGQPFAIDQTGLTSAMPYPLFSKSKLFQSALELNGKETWGFIPPSEKLFVGDSDNKIVLAKLIKSVDLRTKGMIIVGVQESKLRKQLINSIDAQALVLDDAGTILTGTESTWIGHSYRNIPNKEIKQLSLSDMPTTLQSSDWLISSASSDLTGWHAVVIQPKDTLLQELNRISMITIIFMSVSLLTALLFSWIATSFITTPMRKLLKSMRMLQTGDFSQRVHFSATDEIGQLGRGYNVMVERIKELIDDVYNTKLKQREAELKTLQEQINPHFLYNTLDMIYLSAQRNGETAIAEMVYSLSRMFRLRLSGGRSIISLEQEMELVQHYLHLQRLRFKNRITFDLDIDPRARHAQVPKLLIQPLVENAVIHGIEPLNGDGFIQVKCQIDSDRLMISVTDNGAGIPYDRLAELNHMFVQITKRSDAGTTTNPSQSFAIRNLQERLMLAFGPEVQLRIDSQEGRGTTASIAIPWEETRDHDECTPG